MNSIRAIVPAAGKGKRLQKVSGDIPKAMFRVADRPMLEVVLENLGFIAPQDVYIVVGYGKDQITEYFGDRYRYNEQTEQLGTGHAVMTCAEDFKDFDGDVLIAFGDMPLFRRSEMEKMCRQHAQNGADCTLMTAENPSLTMWARVLRDEKGEFAAIVEGKDCTPEQAQIKELFSGVMVFNSRSLFQVLPQVGCANVQGEYYVTEVPELMVKKGMKVQTYFTADGDDLRGINTPEDLEACEKILKERYAFI
ncbi:MAG: NTP transferase domain-containing protein [Oscillospiraceae bacterium]|nr:NTP transferase domain-containing protein [Oscillospiraceae bacterium]